MKKSLIVVLVILLGMTAFLPAASAAPVQFSFKELGVAMEVPDSFLVLTRDTPADDPFLASIGMTKEDLVKEFDTNGIYIDAIAIENNKVYEMLVTIKDNEDAQKIFNIKEFKDYYTQKGNNRYGTTEEYMDKAAAEILSGLKKNQPEISWNYIGAFDDGKAFFYIFHSEAEIQGVKTEGMQYLTIVNGHTIGVGFVARGTVLNDQHLTTLEDAVKSIQFTGVTKSNETNFKKMLDAEEPLLSRVLRDGLIGAATFGIAALITVQIKKRNKRKQEEKWREETDQADKDQTIPRV